MSATAVEPATPTLPTGVLGNPPATDVGAAQAFAQAIQLALGLAPTTPSTAGAAGTPGDAATPSDATSDAKADTTDASTTGVDASALVGTAPAVVVPLVPLPVSTPTATKDAPVLAQVASVAPASAAPVSAQPTAQPAATAAPKDEAVPGTAAPKESRSDTAAPAAPVPAAADAASTPAPATPQVTTGAPVTTAAPVANQVAAAAPASPAPAPVASQVIPEVTKLFSNGEGVHRVTLELSPKALGDVRVVLTVRNGDVHVRLAAGTEAREALAHSAGDLTRALEHIGVKEHRLTLAALPGVTPGAGTQTPSDSTDSQQQQQLASFTGRFDNEQHHDSRQPRMDDGSRATDGTDHDHGSRTRGDRSIHEVSSVPVRGGVDLRM